LFPIDAIREIIYNSERTPKECPLNDSISPDKNLLKTGIIISAIIDALSDFMV